MQKALKTWLRLVSCSLVALGPLCHGAPAATVLSIGDGDTISVLEQGRKLKVRLACIDAPETAQTPFGVASRNQLKALLPLGSPVSLRVQAVDRYGRTLAELVGKGPINLVMVQAQRLGVWAVPGGIRRPLDFRPGGGGERRSGTMPQTATSSAPASSPQDSQPGGAKTTCKQIGSYARAQELLRQGHRTLDRNGDGVACEWLR